MLMDLDQARSWVTAQEELVRSLKLALVSNDPKRLPDMFPALVPHDNTKAVQALDSGAPVEIRTTVTAMEAQDFLRRMESGEFDVTEIDDLMSEVNDDGWDF